MKRSIIFMAAVLLLTASAFASGCTGTDSQKVVQAATTQTTAAVQTDTAAVTAQPSAEDLEWNVWRQDSNEITLKALWGYFAFSPNVNGQKFKALKVQVTASSPITVLFLNDKELSNFKNKIATNSGDFTAIERYDDVNYKEIEVYSDEYLNLVLWNQKDKVVTASADIWYKNLL